MNIKNKVFTLAILVGLLITLVTPFSYAQTNIDVAGIGFNIPEQGYVFLSFDNYFTAIVNGSGNSYYDYFFKPGTQSLKYDICFIKDSLNRHSTFDSYFNSAIKLESGAKFGDIMNNIPKEELLDETFLVQVKEAKVTNGKLEFVPYIEPSEPTATVTITPHSLLNEGFKLANVKVNVSGIEGAAKYSITYSVYDNDNNEKTVTTKLANVGQVNEDLIQYIDAETSKIKVNLFDVNNNQINTEYKTTIK